MVEKMTPNLTNDVKLLFLLIEQVLRRILIILFTFHCLKT